MLRVFSFFPLIALLFLSDCTGSEESGGAAQGMISAREIPADSRLPSFEPLSNSPHIQISRDRMTLRLAYSFFPDGSQPRFETKSVTIPCSFHEKVPEWKSAPPIERACDEPFVLTFQGKGEKFTKAGIEVPLNGRYEKLSRDFEMVITPEGIRDQDDGQVLSAGSGKLEDLYGQIMDKRYGK